MRDWLPEVLGAPGPHRLRQDPPPTGTSGPGPAPSIMLLFWTEVQWGAQGWPLGHGSPAVWAKLPGVSCACGAPCWGEGVGARWGCPVSGLEAEGRGARPRLLGTRSEWGNREGGPEGAGEVPGRLSCAAGAGGPRRQSATVWGVGVGLRAGCLWCRFRLGPGWGAPMEGGVQRPVIRDSPAPRTHGPLGPETNLARDRAQGADPHPWQLGRGGHRGRTLPLRGPESPSW